jgi:hypothetical protein
LLPWALSRLRRRRHARQYFCEKLLQAEKKQSFVCDEITKIKIVSLSKCLGRNGINPGFSNKYLI